MYLFLDDTRDPIDAYSETGDKIYRDSNWDVVKSFKEFCIYIERNFFDKKEFPKLVSFDHNLAPEHYQTSFGNIPYDKYKEETGWHCALWLKGFCQEHNINIPKVLSHSASPQGKQNILDVFYK